LTICQINYREESCDSEHDKEHHCPDIVSMLTLSLCGVLGMVAFKQLMCRWYRKNSADPDLVEHRNLLLFTRSVSELQIDASNLERSSKL